ncbi:MAG TPA: tRNA (adenosine(37)-N6)-threonylcarbamoyltransferase complex dimerization subunit type 1 TsaB [Phycisphaerae bacterium]|nr:tRNA (adenosine(37)-N6)-threonylcarbamoyltransferase complex dimerization subunit type 1 TsaB [Phycisphaerae bacterium]
MSEWAKILAIETSSRAGSVALGVGGDLVMERVLPAGSRHANALMPMVAGMMAEAGWKAGELEQVYVSIGPGSFTGLRIAVAVARALAQAIGGGEGGVRLVAVPTLEVIAENAPGEFGMVLPVLDAKRGQVFAGVYGRDAAGGLSAIELPQVAAPEAIVELALGRAGRIALLGEGVDYHRERFAAAVGGGRVVEAARELWVPRAGVVHKLGYARAVRGEFTEAGALVPAYIRLPEAEEVYRRKHGGGSGQWSVVSSQK